MAAIRSFCAGCRREQFLFRLTDAFSDASAGAASLAEQSGILMDAQSKLDAVSVAYYNKTSPKQYAACRRRQSREGSGRSRAAKPRMNCLISNSASMPLLGGLFGLESDSTRAARVAVEIVDAVF